MTSRSDVAVARGDTTSAAHIDNHCSSDWQCVCGSERDRRRAFPERLMHWSATNFLSDRFPELEHPRYQSALEKVSFILVTSMLVGSLLVAMVMVIYEL